MMQNLWIIILYPDILMPECSIKRSVIILFTIPGPRNIELHAYYHSTKCNYFCNKWDMTNESAEVCFNELTCHLTFSIVVDDSTIVTQLASPFQATSIHYKPRIAVAILDL